ncbi:hypothetical protein GCM10018952_28490 [Streptosporangium vulgare]
MVATSHGPEIIIPARPFSKGLSESVICRGGRGQQVDPELERVDSGLLVEQDLLALLVHQGASGGAEEARPHPAAVAVTLRHHHARDLRSAWWIFAAVALSSSQVLGGVGTSFLL